MKKLIFLICFLLVTSNLFAQTNFTEWTKDCKNCDSLLIDGSEYRLIRVEQKVFIALVGKITDDYIVVDVFVSNISDKRFDLLPEKSTMFVWESKKDWDKQVGYVYNPIPPEKVIKKLESKTKWSNFWTGLAGNLATRQVNSNSTETGSATIYGNGTSASGTYDSTTQTTTTVPDRQAQANAQSKIAENKEKTAEKVNIVTTESLKANTLMPKDEIAGRIYFPKKKKYYAVAIQFVVDGHTYGFLYSGTEK